MKSHILLFTSICLLLVTGGCGSTGAFNSANITQVQLSEGNYNIAATNVKGEATAGYLVGISPDFSPRNLTVSKAKQNRRREHT